MSKNTVTALISAGLSFMGLFIERYGLVITLVCISIVLDVLTGIIKSKVLATTNSTAGFIGFWKKISLLTALLFGFFLDLAEGYLMACVSSQSGEFTVRFAFGIWIGLYIMLNESISICENLQQCGVKLPRFVATALVKRRNELDQSPQRGKDRKE